MSACFSKKDYNCVISNCLDMEKEYLSLSEDDKKFVQEIPANIYYNLTCGYAMAGEKEKAVNAFTKAVDNGYIEYRHAKADTDLNSIRDNKTFQNLLDSIRERGDYIYILQKTGPYIKRPVFTYEEKNSPDLIKIKEYFRLDSIAGNGDELSKILNLMTWAHNTIKHDGSYWADINMTAISIYEHAKKNNTGMNCRSQAIFLNECYLALGIKSRYVTCCPRDNYNQKAHVINTVYSKYLNKWIWIDATFNTYVKDDKGTFLSIYEVRNRLIENKPVLISESANWNNRQNYTKEMYIDDYMAELLYWYSCPVVNKCNTDNDMSPNSFVSLLPDGFHKDKWKFEYFTTDEDYFWEKN
jgi:hypothetical protein